MRFDGNSAAATCSCFRDATVNTRNTSRLGDAAEDFPSDRIFPPGDFACRNLLRLLPSNENHFIAALHFFERRHVHHDLVHCHAANDRAPCAVDEYLRLIRQMTAEAIRITRRHRRDFHRLLGRKRLPITNGSSCRYLLDVGHARFERKRRQKLVGALKGSKG